MDDDINTPVAIATLQKLRSDANKLLDRGISANARRAARDEFRSIGSVLGLFQLDRWQFGSAVSEPVSASIDETETVRPVITDTDIERLLKERNEARCRKDFSRADEIRNSLAAQGIIIEDKPDGTSRWKR